MSSKSIEAYELCVEAGQIILDLSTFNLRLDKLSQTKKEERIFDYEGEEPVDGFKKVEIEEISDHEEEIVSSQPSSVVLEGGMLSFASTTSMI